VAKISRDHHGVNGMTIISGNYSSSMITKRQNVSVARRLNRDIVLYAAERLNGEETPKRKRSQLLIFRPPIDYFT
jgi:hypothetical protein